MGDFFDCERKLRRVQCFRVPRGEALNLLVAWRLGHSGGLYVGVAGDVIIVLGLSSRRCRMMLCSPFPDKTKLNVDSLNYR